MDMSPDTIAAVIRIRNPTDARYKKSISLLRDRRKSSKALAFSRIKSFILYVNSRLICASCYITSGNDI